jgi:adenine-specific DNA-methyltransferase
MKNRLDIAKDLLRNDGFIFVQCDDNEQAYLKILMDDPGLFKKENNRSIIYLETVYPNKTLKQDRVFHDQIEQILIYAKSQGSKIKQQYEDYSYDKFCWYIKEKSKPIRKLQLGNKKVEIFDQNGFEIKLGARTVKGLKEVWASGTILDMNSSGRYFRDYLMDRTDIDGYNKLYKVYGIGDDNNAYRYFSGPKKKGATKGKYYQGVPKDKLDIELAENKEMSIENFWPMAGDFGNCRSEGGVEFKSGKKPEKLLQRIIEMSTDPGDLVIDFFSGCGTSAAVSHKLGRKYIGIEQLDYGLNDCVIRLKNVLQGDPTGISESVNWKGSGSFIYCKLMEWNEAYISKIKKAKTSKELIAIWEEMQSKSFISYKVDMKAINENIVEFKDLSLEDQKRFLIEVLDKNQLYVNYSEIDDKEYGVSETDKKLNRQFYGEA